MSIQTRRNQKHFYSIKYFIINSPHQSSQYYMTLKQMRVRPQHLLTFLQGATFSYVYLLLGLLVSRLDNQKEKQAKMVVGNIPQYEGLMVALQYVGALCQNPCINISVDTLLTCYKFTIRLWLVCQQDLDGLPRILVQTIMFPRGWRRRSPNDFN